jgi:hypothetical protein
MDADPVLAKDRALRAKNGARRRTVLTALDHVSELFWFFHLPFVGTRCFSSSNQLRTTTILAGVTFGLLSSPLLLTIRNRWPSSDSS